MKLWRAYVGVYNTLIIVQMHMKKIGGMKRLDSGPWLCSIDDDYDEPTEMMSGLLLRR